MKTKTKSLILGAILLFSFSIHAQWQSDEVLSGIKNPQNYSTLQLAQMDRNLSTFTNLVYLSGLAPSMLMTDAHTVFIPTNEAFKQMSLDNFLHLTNSENKGDLIRFLKYHFLSEKIQKNDFKDSQVITTNGDKEITVSVDEPYGTAYIGGAKIIKSDTEANNGIIHVIDGVISPSNDDMFD